MIGRWRGVTAGHGGGGGGGGDVGLWSGVCCVVLCVVCESMCVLYIGREK